MLAKQEHVFNCPICFEENIPLRNSITLTCGHRYCKDCLINDWQLKIDQGYVSTESLRCQTDKCKTIITNYELRGNLSSEYYKKYDKKTLENFRSSPINKEIFVMCKKCQTPYFVFNGASYFHCENCKIRFCINCNGDWKIHEGIDCDEYQEKTLNKEEYELRKMLEMEGIIACPHCKTVVLKKDGCNFMYCSSQLCQGKKFFCYLCGDPLLEKDHYSHFLGDPYGKQKMTCLTIEEKLKKGEIIGKKINKKAAAAQIPPNLIGCPKCGTKNPNECEILVDFENKICFCKTCGNKHFCIKCKKEVSDNDIFDHMIEQ